jgi:hypothetical protein
MATRWERKIMKYKGNGEWSDPILSMLRFERQRLEEQARGFEKEHKGLPEGCISYKTINGRRYYYHTIAKSSKRSNCSSPGSSDEPIRARQRFLGKEDQRLKEALWKKRSLEETLPLLYGNIRAIDRFETMYVPATAWPNKDELQTAIASKRGRRSRLVLWEHEEFESNPYHPEGLIHATLTGLRVRSKSEAIIAGLLETNKVPFRYEARLDLSTKDSNENKYVYPDFTVKRVSDGALFFWEHFGMTNNPDYLDSMQEKMAAYQRAGITPWNQLITTFDTKNGSLDIRILETLIRGILL